MSRSTRRPIVVLALGLLLATTVVGCGDSEGVDALGNDLDGGTEATTTVAEEPFAEEGGTTTSVVTDAGEPQDPAEEQPQAVPTEAPEEVPVTPADDPDCRTPEDAATAGATEPDPVVPADLATAPFAADDVPGCGELVTETSAVTVNYVLKSATTGQIVDSSYGGEPFEVDIAQGGVITGWLFGLPGMRAGGRRTLVLPPEYGYGAQGSGDQIPPDDTLVFIIDALSVA